MTEQAPDERSILEAAEEDPDEVDVEAVLAVLEADQGTPRVVALRSLTLLAQDDPDRVIDHVDRIIEALEDGFPPAESAAARLLSVLAQDYPGEVRPALAELVHMLDQDPPMTGYRSARALAQLLYHDPEGFVPHADYLLDVLVDPPEVYAPTPEELKEMPDGERERVKNLLESRREAIAQDTARTYGIRELAANALVEVADVEPDAVSDRIDELPSVLSEEPGVVRAATIDVIANVAQEDPDAVEPAVEALIRVVEEDVESVQAHAVRALGYANATEAIDSLRDLAQADVDPELSGLAADTADFLADRT